MAQVLFSVQFVFPSGTLKRGTSIAWPGFKLPYAIPISHHGENVWVFRCIQRTLIPLIIFSFECCCTNANDFIVYAQLFIIINTTAVVE